jgi:CheY-like chemotaxis protein
VSLKILLADDSMTAQNMGKKILTDAGYEVLTVSNGAAALKKITAGHFDLLLLDVMMPGYTGPEVCAKARELKGYEKTPILFSIGKMEMGTFKVEDAPKLKADGVIIKPFEASDLITAVQKITAGAAAAARPKPTVPPEAEKTARITPITEETDQSFAEWSAAAPEHREDGEEAAPAHAVEMPAEAASTAAFAEMEAAPAFDVAADSAPAFDLGAAPAYETVSAESTASVLATGSDTAEIPAIPLQTVEAPAAASPSFASDLQTTPEPIDVGPVAPAPGLEFTSAAPVQVKIDTAPELEIPSHLDGTATAADPNFDSDRSRMVEQFATRFSAAGEDVSVGIAAPEPETTVKMPAYEEPGTAKLEPLAEVGGDTDRIEPLAETGSGTIKLPPLEKSGGDTAKMTPWVNEAAPPVFSQSPGKIVTFAPAAELEKFLATPVEDQVGQTAPVLAPVAEAAPAEPATAVAMELEQAMTAAAVPEAPPAPEPAPAPATLEASLEQSLQPEPTVTALIESPAEPAPVEEPSKPAGDLEFAQALEAAIASAPEAPPEPHHEAPPEHAAAAAAGAGHTSLETAVATAETAAAEQMPELSGVDPQIIAHAIERVLANAKHQILEEVLKELKK